MCVVSNIGDGWKLDQWPEIKPHFDDLYKPKPEVTKEDFNKLRQGMEELKKLLLAAKQYDAATGQPDCEVEDKVGLIKKVAAALGVSMEDVFPDE